MKLGLKVKDRENKEEKNNTEEEIDKKIAELLSGGDEKNSENTSENRFKFIKRPKKTRKIIIIAIIIVILFIISKAMFGGKASVMPAVSKLSKGEIVSSLTITGPIEGTDSVDVTSNLHAKVTELNVKEGDSVIEGETVLARLDTSDIEEEIENAEGSLDLLKAQREEKIKDEQAQYEKALQDLNSANEDFSRKQALHQTGDISQVDYETSLNALNDARRAVEAFNVKDGRVAADESTDIEIANSERNLQQVRDKLQDAVVKAPISGTVTRVYTKVGQFADKTDDSNNPMIVVENLDELQMKVKISEYSIGSLKLGQPVEISADILGDETVSGEIVNISPTGEEKGGGSTERVIPTTISIKDNSKLIAGITAKAEIVLDKAEDTFSVPISAISDDGNGTVMMQFVVTDESTRTEGEGISSVSGTVKSVPVETGIEGDINIEIKDILSDEDKSLLKEGALYLTTYDPAYEGVSGTFSY